MALCEGYKVKVSTASNDDQLNTLEKYVSVATALSRVMWTYQKEYSGVENLMVESQEFIVSVINKGVSSMINRE